MATTIPSTALVPVAPILTNTERLALAGFLAGHSGLARQAYELDLRQFASWCQQHQLHLFGARHADIEFFARDLETRGRARATITRRLCTIAGFYRYAVEEEVLDHSPAAHVRRPPGTGYSAHRCGSATAFGWSAYCCSGGCAQLLVGRVARSLNVAGPCAGLPTLLNGPCGSRIGWPAR